MFNKKEELLSTLCEYKVPVSRATWLIKMNNAYHTAISEARNRRRVNIDSFTGRNYI